MANCVTLTNIYLKIPFCNFQWIKLVTATLVCGKIGVETGS